MQLTSDTVLNKTQVIVLSTGPNSVTGWSHRKPVKKEEERRTQSNTRDYIRAETVRNSHVRLITDTARHGLFALPCGENRLPLRGYMP